MRLINHNSITQIIIYECITILIVNLWTNLKIKHLQLINIPMKFHDKITLNCVTFVINDILIRNGDLYS